MDSAGKRHNLVALKCLRFPNVPYADDADEAN